ncbi:hypothetical protein PoB_000644700 [Plakobranchus ocellatus]|uniref:Uncharacterized protein n=1 Tax=Plakobranchus ocellatus TaxID=259542 RepID=A0AAV3YCW3_9GAST|nr:hypothetical protein PoB_000644700 [Plakobranchus ocellatus]
MKKMTPHENASMVRLPDCRASSDPHALLGQFELLQEAMPTHKGSILLNLTMHPTLMTRTATMRVMVRVRPRCFYPTIVPAQPQISARLDYTLSFPLVTSAVTLRGQSLSTPTARCVWVNLTIGSCCVCCRVSTSSMLSVWTSGSR